MISTARSGAMGQIPSGSPSVGRCAAETNPYPTVSRSPHGFFLRLSGDDLVFLVRVQVKIDRTGHLPAFLCFPEVFSAVTLLAPLPLRLALLGKGAGALFGVLGTQQLIVEMTREGGECGLAHIQPAVGQLLEIANR